MSTKDEGDKSRFGVINGGGETTPTVLDKTDFEVKKGGILSLIEEHNFTNEEVKQKIQFVFGKAVYCFDGVKNLFVDKDLSSLDRKILAHKIKRNVMQNLNEIVDSMSSGKTTVVTSEKLSDIENGLNLVVEHFINSSVTELDKQEKNNILGKILALVFASIDSHEIPREDYINFLSKLSTQV